MTKASKVIITNGQTEVKIPTGIRLLVRRCCNAVIFYEKIGKLCEISVTFVNNEQIRAFNNQYRGKDVKTDVLSFPLCDDGNFQINPDTGYVILGDIVISMETAERQAVIYGHTFEEEVAFLTVHSMLHLLGYDHERNYIEAAKMRDKEQNILSGIGLNVRNFRINND